MLKVEQTGSNTFAKGGAETLPGLSKNGIGIGMLPEYVTGI
jgi:hypothetical protein